MKTKIDKQIKMPLYADIMNLIGFTPDKLKKQGQSKEYVEDS